MNGSFKIMRILGIDIRIHYSWFFILLLIYYSLAVAYFPELYKGLEVVTYHIMAAISSLMLFVCVLFHELFHAIVGNKNRVPVKSIVLFIFGGVSQITEEPPSAKVELWMALAGPLSSIFLAVLFFGLSRLPQPTPVVAVFEYLWQINAILAVFNLIPAFPLDGGRVLRAVLWAKSRNIKKATRQSLTVTRFFSYSFIFVGLIFVLAGNIIGGIWLGVIGWFLLQAAQQSYDQLMIKGILEQTRISELLQKKVPTVHSRESVTNALRKIFHARVTDLPVIDKNEFKGIVSLPSLKLIRAKTKKTVQEVMIPAISLFKLKVTDTAYDALQQMLRLGVNLLPVYAGKNYRGVVTKESLLFLLSFNEK